MWRCPLSGPLLFLDMPRQVDGLDDDEDQHQAHAAKVTGNRSKRNFMPVL
jgi:hypothetical protein